MRMDKVLKILGIMSVLTMICVYSHNSTAANGAGGFPEIKKINGKSLVLNGTGIRDEPVYHAKVYEAGLYLEEKTRNPRRIMRGSTVKHLELRFLGRTREYSVRKSWEEGFRKQAGDDLDKHKSSIDKLVSWTTSMAAGDSYAFTYLPEKGLEIRVKNQLKGVISGEDFSRIFFSIWLGRDPVNQNLKAGLLGR